MKNELNFILSNRMLKIIRYLIACSSCFLGLVYMLSTIIRSSRWDGIISSWPIAIHHGHSITIVTGFFLILLSYGLMRGKHQFWRISILLVTISTIVHIVHHGSIVITLLESFLILILIIFKKAFQAKSDPPLILRGYIVLVISSVLIVFYTIGGFIVLYRDLAPEVEHYGFVDTFIHFITFTTLRFVPQMQVFLFVRTFNVLCICSILYAMFLLLRPVCTVLLPNEKEHQNVMKLVQLYGQNSISYFALSQEKSYFMSSTGQSVISYVVKGTVCVVAGDPIGPIDETLLVINQFLTFCQQQDWTVVFWQTKNDFRQYYQLAGLHTFKIGEDAIIHINQFTLSGGIMSNVRSSMKRAEKEGVRVLFFYGQVQNDDYCQQMQQISQKWLAQKGGSEMGFSMGHFDLQGDPNQITALAIDGHQKIHAFMTFIPIYGRCGWGLDLMRRDEQSIPGVSELLLVRFIEFVKGQGAEIVSLGLAPLSNANNENETFLDTSVEFVTQRFGNLKKSQSLFNFKNKFQPTWESRYLVYSNTLTLPTVGWALYQAHQSTTSLLFLQQYIRQQYIRHQYLRTIFCNKKIVEV